MTTAAIVHYHGGNVFERCVDSCVAEGSITEIIAVDNGGGVHDDRVRVVTMPRNAGYGRAANTGLDAAADGPVLVLNQDAVVPPGAVRGLLDAGTAADAWLVGPRLVDLEGAVNASGATFPWPFDAPVSPPDASWRYVPWLAGAALLFMPGHTDLRFDPRYFMYVEDEDLCARVWAGGGRVVRADGVTVVHEGGTAARARWSNSSISWRILLGRTRMVRAHRGVGAAAAYGVRRLVRARPHRT